MSVILCLCNRYLLQKEPLPCSLACMCAPISEGNKSLRHLGRGREKRGKSGLTDWLVLPLEGEKCESFCMLKSPPSLSLLGTMDGTGNREGRRTWDISPAAALTEMYSATMFGGRIALILNEYKLTCLITVVTLIVWHFLPNQSVWFQFASRVKYLID